MSSQHTLLATPHVVTRTLTHRLVAKIDGNGQWGLWNGAFNVAITPPVTLGAGQSIKATFVAADVTRGIGVVVQPTNWTGFCVGESSAMLGSVNFPFLGGSAYAAYPQSARQNEIEVEFRRTPAGGVQFVISVDDNTGIKNVHAYDVSDRATEPDPAKRIPDGYAVAFVGFTETVAMGSVAPGASIPPGGQTTVTFTLAGAPLAGPYDLG